MPPLKGVANAAVAQRSAVRWATTQRFHRAFHQVRRTFARLGVPVVCACANDAVSLILNRLERLRVQLDERSPLRVLQRGYAICTDAAGNVVSTADQVSVGAEVTVQLARGRLGAEVKRREIPKP